MGGGRLSFIGDTRPGSAGGGADRDRELTAACEEKTGTGGTFFGEVAAGGGSDVLDERLAGDETVDGEKGDEGTGEGGMGREGRGSSDEGRGGGAAREPLAPRATAVGGGGGTLDMRPCCLRYEVYMVPLLRRSRGGLGFFSSAVLSELDLVSSGWTAAALVEEEEGRRMAGMGGGMTLGRRCSTRGLGGEAAEAMLGPLAPRGDDAGEAEGEVGVLRLSERRAEPAATLTLIFRPSSECQALQWPHVQYVADTLP